MATTRTKIPLPNIKRMSTDMLLAATDRVAVELQRRIDTLAEAQRSLGVEGLRLQSKGMQRIVVKFPNSYKKYEYDAPLSAAVGDTVKTPTTLHGGPGFAEVVALGPNGYTGPIKEVIAVYKKVD